MGHRRRRIILAGASLVALGAHGAARAEGAPGAGRGGAGAGTTVSEIVVTARRRSERLQDVPQSINAVTADTLDRLKLQHFQDIETVVPGLTLQQGSS